VSEADHSSRVDVSRNSNDGPVSRRMNFGAPPSLWGSTNTTEDPTFGGHNRSWRDSDRGSINGQQSAVQQAEPSNTRR
jgi:hypothetical protein